MARRTVTELHYRIEIGRALRHLRNIKGLTQLDVAQALSITVPTISHYENSKGSMPGWMILRLRDLYDIDLYQLITETRRHNPA